MKSLVACGKGMARAIALVLLLGALAGCAGRTISAYNVLTDHLAEPLNGVTTAKVDINAGDGNLTIDRLTGGELLLAGGTLQYLKKQGPPSRTMTSFLEQATLTLQAEDAEQPRVRLPWAAYNGATEWQIHLNPTVSSVIAAHSNGGNVKLDLTGMAVTRVSADTGGGNVYVILPDNAADLSVTAETGAGDVTVDVGNGTTGSNVVNAKSGAGKVIVRIPSGVAARIHAASGLGKGTIDPRFSKIDGSTYQSPDYDSATNRVQIAVSSGAGDIIVSAK